ncbi:hypothetical protein M3Y97_00617300 [Aphelenchoides bicaudatus]|nr:hypothetical protein M3Y97_00617300 [Aphelenchoides bicaudatus]
MKTYAVKFNFLFVSMLQGVILMGVYSSWILSQKLATDRTGDLNGIKELIAALEDKSRYLVSTTASDWFFEQINKSETYPHNAIRAALQKNPIRFRRTMGESLQEANTKGGMIALVEDDRLMFLSKSYCNLVLMDEPISIVSAHLLFRKNSPMVKAVDEAIVKNEMLIAKAFRKYMDYAERQEHGRCNNQKTTALAKPYYGLCFIWGGLMLVALGFVIIECLISTTCRYFKKQSPKLVPIIPFMDPILH